MPEITCDFLVPLTVRVDTDADAVIEVMLHLEDFQSGPSGRWVAQANPDGSHTLTFRSAYLGEFDGEPAYACDGESALGDAALALADRVALDQTDVRLRFQLTAATPGGREGTAG